MSNNRILVYLKNELPFVCMPLIGCAIPVSFQLHGVVDYRQIMQFHFFEMLPYLVFLLIGILGVCFFVFRLVCCFFHCIILFFKDKDDEIDVSIMPKVNDAVLPDKQVNESNSSSDFAYVLFGLWLTVVVFFALFIAVIALIDSVPIFRNLLFSLIFK